MARNLKPYYVAKDLADGVDAMGAFGGCVLVQDGELRIFNQRQTKALVKDHPEYKDTNVLLKDVLRALRAWGMPDDCIVDEMRNWSNDGKASVGATHIEDMLKEL